MSASRDYIHPKARAALDKAIAAANLAPVIVQTQGNAPQSAGTHGSAGTYTENGVHHSYSPCIDFSVQQSATRLSDKAKVAMNEMRIRWFLEHLAEQGICAFYRLPSQGFDAAHIHAITAMVAMPPLCQNQVIDFVSGRNGLKGHATEQFWHASEAYDGHIATLFAIANPAAAGRLPSRYRGSRV